MTVSGEKMANKIKMLLLKKKTTLKILRQFFRNSFIFSKLQAFKLKKQTKKTLRLLKLKRERERNYNQQYKNSKFKQISVTNM